MKYKLLALDIDDTTLRHDGTLSENNRKAILKVQENGGYVVIITGRSPMAALPIWNKVPTNDICICFGGAVTLNMKTGAVLETSAVEPELVTEALCLAGELGLVSQIYVDNRVVTEFENPYTRAYVNYLGLEAIIEPDIKNIRYTGIPKILFFADKKKQPELIERISSHFEGRLSVSASTKTFIELNQFGMDKGTGLINLCRLLGITPQEVVAMGDSLLDVPMLKVAGVGIAVENANDFVKANADVISPDCDSDAVAWAVEKYFS